MIGWIKINRSIMEHWIWKDPIKLKWWLDILMTVNFKDAKILIGNHVVECKRGQSLLSLQSWADRWKVDKSKVRRFFILLQNENIIETESVQKTTRLTVLNYDSYQSNRNDDETMMKRKRNDDETIATPIEESKQEIKKNKESKELVFESLWVNYPTKKNKQESLKRFLKLTDIEIEKVKIHLPIFSKVKEFETYTHPHLSTYFNRKTFNDPIEEPKAILFGTELSNLITWSKPENITREQYDSLPPNSKQNYSQCVNQGKCKIL